MSKSFVVNRAALALSVGVLAAGAAGAQTMVNARVLSSTPVWEQVPVPDCGGAYPGAMRPSGPGTAVGALVGGLLGSQLGRGSGHIAGAILGTVGGAMLGNAAEAQAGYPGACGTRYENRVTGYDVSYEVAGRPYRTRMPQDPGAWVQVPAPEQGYGAYGAAPGVQTYPVNPSPMAGYPLPAYPAAGELSAPPEYGGYQATYPPRYSNPYPYPGPYPAPGYSQAYPPVHAQPVYPPQVVYPAAPVYVRPAPMYAAPVGVNLSIGGIIGGRGHRRGGWGVGVGSGF
ncbi:glycine zipper 2TM domain-containing protein [Ottowia testudinis]|uniref:Glycine zipper 2TM domain-containing protein n=1 Tax=Ottowia testudinis TaxID=2816950 RepID=A0A975H3C2_9BURK|nr:glycine zipper 2TM domain-containing protein [Ottowia testudinis]QTD45679.1 glycine zipper 2TM domain-containing protein [Ottowia testudinis]